VIASIDSGAHLPHTRTAAQDHTDPARPVPAQVQPCSACSVVTTPRTAISLADKTLRHLIV